MTAAGLPLPIASVGRSGIMTVHDPKPAQAGSCLQAIVLAGGFGYRLRRATECVSGERCPKQFCRLGTSRSLLQRTLDRIAPLVAPENTLVVFDESMRALANAQLRDFPGVLAIYQPMNRGTAPGILLPLSKLADRDPSGIVLLVPSDHGFGHPGAFRDVILQARKQVGMQPKRMVLVGCEASHAAGDLGWILPRRARGERSEDTMPVERFEEKPSGERATALLAAGALWNTMILVARSRALLELFRRRLPETTRVFDACATLPERVRGSWLRRKYDSLPTTDFSAGILEGAPNLAVVSLRRDSGWTDLGTPERLTAWLARSAGGREADQTPGDLLRSGLHLDLQGTQS